MQMKSASRVKSPLAIEVEMPLSGGIYYIKSLLLALILRDLVKLAVEYSA